MLFYKCLLIVCMSDYESKCCKIFLESCVCKSSSFLMTPPSCSSCSLLLKNSPYTRKETAVTKFCHEEKFWYFPLKHLWLHPWREKKLFRQQFSLSVQLCQLKFYFIIITIVAIFWFLINWYFWYINFIYRFSHLDLLFMLYYSIQHLSIVKRFRKMELLLNNLIL